MPYLTWNSSYELGIESIDKQHRKLVDLLNDFYSNIKNRTNTEIIYTLISGMKEYVIMHQRFEIEMLRKYGFEFTDEHDKEHAAFIQKINDIEKRQKMGFAVVSYEITDFLKKWLQEHILIQDKKIAPFLKSKGAR